MSLDEPISKPETQWDMHQALNAYPMWMISFID